MMKKISEEMERKVNEEIKKYQLTLTQAKVVLFLSETPEKKATQKELENFLQVSHPTTVTIVKSMQLKGMIETSFDEEDRRMKILKLIWGNEQVYKELSQNAGQMEIGLLKGFSEEEKEQFLGYMKRVYKNTVQ